MSRLSVAAATALVLTMLGSTPAWAAKPAKTSSATTTGIDASYPQCGSSLPSGEAFAIIGVNGGLANDYNSCVAQEWQYAASLAGIPSQAKAQTYLNTADPGNTVADWPSSQYPGSWGTSGLNSPYPACADSPPGVGADSPGCAYAYGYDMVEGFNKPGVTISGDAAAFSNATRGSIGAQPAWLDVETANSWQSGTNGLAMNVADLQGMVAALQHAGVPLVGVYSTSYQWGKITGGASSGSLHGLPDWIPGARAQSGAASNCSLSSFTAGKVTLTQWTSRLDNDYSCLG